MLYWPKCDPLAILLQGRLGKQLSGVFSLYCGRQPLPIGKKGNDGSWEATNRGRASLSPPMEDEHKEERGLQDPDLCSQARDHLGY